MMMPYMKRHGADNLWKVGTCDEEIEGEKVGTYEDIDWRRKKKDEGD